MQGSIEKADVASELWSKNDRANLVNDGNFMLLMPVGATNEGLHNILDVLYGKQTEGGSFTDEVTQLHPFLVKILAACFILDRALFSSEAQGSRFESR